jgi:hypothetical protein
VDGAAPLNIHGQVLLGSNIAVKQPTEFDFIANFTIAKASKTIAESFILHADEASNNSVFCCAA